MTVIHTKQGFDDLNAIYIDLLKTHGINHATDEFTVHQPYCDTQSLSIGIEEEYGERTMTQHITDSVLFLEPINGYFDVLEYREEFGDAEPIDVLSDPATLIERAKTLARSHGLDIITEDFTVIQPYVCGLGATITVTGQGEDRTVRLAFDDTTFVLPSIDAQLHVFAEGIAPGEFE